MPEIVRLDLLINDLFGDMTLYSVLKNVKLSDELELSAETSDEFVLKIKYISDKSEVMQIPIKIYLDDKNAGVCMARGSGNKEEEALFGLYLIKGKHKIRLQFEDNCLEMSINVQSKFTQNSETALILQPA